MKKIPIIFLCSLLLLVLTSCDGGRYEGDYVDGKKSGKGVYTWPNGHRYEGDWVNDKRNGKGTLFAQNGSVLKKGIWKNNIFVESR
jgi:hypothetical protein